jgi:YesN/AraC family two-component response regulator
LTENGLEAWEQACEIIPDIIISDVMMPIMDGFTLCEKIKSDNRTSHIPVVLLTAKNAEKDQITGLETGADIYISKPFSIKILELSIRNIIQAREKLRHKFNTQLVKLHQQEIVPNSTDHLFINTVERDFLVNVINIIESHLDDPEFGVDKLAKKVAMSTPILYKKIKAVSNMSVNDFVKSIRLKKGAQLLLEKTLTINEVSFTVGFNDRKYFSREFKKQYGVNPKDYVSNNNSTPA